MIETAAQEVKQHGAFGTIFEQIGLFQVILNFPASNKCVENDKSIAGRA